MTPLTGHPRGGDGRHVRAPNGERVPCPGSAAERWCGRSGRGFVSPVAVEVVSTGGRGRRRGTAGRSKLGRVARQWRESSMFEHLSNTPLAWATCVHRSVSAQRRTTSASCARPHGRARVPRTPCGGRCGGWTANGGWRSSGRTQKRSKTRMSTRSRKPGDPRSRPSDLILVGLAAMGRAATRRFGCVTVGLAASGRGRDPTSTSAPYGIPAG